MGSKRKRAAKDGAEGVANGSKRSKSNAAAAKSASKAYLKTSPFVEQPVDDERRREGTLYDLLGSEEESERLESAVCIISSLIGDDPVPEVVLQRHLEKRLFRGLASGRNASRIGFSLVITELLNKLFGVDALGDSTYPGLTFEKVLAFLLDKTKVVGNVQGQEERDHFLGQLFGLECFVKSGILFLDTKRWRKVLGVLLAMGNKKVWLRPQCGWVIVQAIGLMDRKEVEYTLQKIAEEGLAKTPEGVGYWLAGLKKHPDLKVKPWGHPLYKKSLGDLTLVLKESFRENDQSEGPKPRNQTQQSSWTAQLHFVWDAILDVYAQGPQGEAENLEQFWTRVVDEGLFSKQATDGQKFKGFMIFQHFLQKLIDQDDKVRSLFTKHFMTCLLNQAAKEDRYLHRAAIKTLKTIENCVATRPEVLPPVLESLLGSKGAYNFDQRTNTKTLDKLLQSIKPTNEEEAMVIISRPIKTISELDRHSAQPLLRSYIDYLSKFLLTTGSSPSGSEAKRSSAIPKLAWKELSRLAYSRPEHIPSAVLTESVKELCRSRLEGSLARLTKQTDDFEIFCDAITTIGQSFDTQDETIKDALKSAKKRMKSLLGKKKGKADEQNNFDQGLAMLHAVAIFQLYNEDPDAVEVLMDLEDFAEKRKEDSETEEGTSELLVEVLLSLVTRPSSLMRQVSQQVFETFTSQISASGLDLVLSPLASEENAKGQQQLFNLEDPDNMDVDAEDGDDSEEDEEEGDNDDVVDLDDVSDVEIDSNVEFIGLNGDAGDEEDDDDDDEEGESSNDSDSDAEVEEDVEGEGEEEGDGKPKPPSDNQQANELEAAISSILQSHRLDKDADAESSSSDGDMSDSEMLVLDEKLAEVFQHRQKARPDSKRDKKDAKQSVVNFKHRLLDLVEIYVKNEAVLLNPLAFAVLTPLLGLMRTTSTKPLGNRACEIILTFQKTLKKARSDRALPQEKGDTTASINNSSAPSSTASSPSKEDLVTLLREIHSEARKDNAHAFAKAASAASLIVASALWASPSAGRESVRDVAAVYAETQAEWILGGGKMQTSFFTDWNNWCQNQASLEAAVNKFGRFGGRIGEVAYHGELLGGRVLRFLIDLVY